MSNSPNPLPPALALQSAAPHQLSIAFDSIQLRKMNSGERAKVLSCLATLLIEAAGAATEGDHDDER